MRGLLIIGGMWCTGVYMLATGLGSPTETASSLGLAFALVVGAWLAALCHAIGNDKGGWLLALFFLPFFAMWAYLLWGLGKAGMARRRRPPEPEGPRVWREALRVVEDAERRRLRDRRKRIGGAG